MTDEQRKYFTERVRQIETQVKQELTFKYQQQHQKNVQKMVESYTKKLRFRANDVISATAFNGYGYMPNTVSCHYVFENFQGVQKSVEAKQKKMAYQHSKDMSDMVLRVRDKANQIIDQVMFKENLVEISKLITELTNLK